MAINLTGPISRTQRALVLVCCALSVGLLTTAERYTGLYVPLGGLFLLPLLVAAPFMSRWPMFLSAIATAMVKESFGRFEWGVGAPERFALTLVTYTGGALFACELARSRRMEAELVRNSRLADKLRSDTEREARALVESSPAGLLTVDSAGRIARANAAARRLLGFVEDSPEGLAVEAYIPVLARILESKEVATLTRTMVEASGRRRDGEGFLAQAWVSTYDASTGPCLAVILLDVTEQVRDREETGLKQLLRNSRVIAGAVSHELRNLAAAAAVLHHNLSRSLVLRDSTDFQALGTVIDSVQRLSSTELSDTSEEALEGLDMGEVLGELRTIVGTAMEEQGVEMEWEVQGLLPMVRAHRAGLLQVFLNLAKNSANALRDRYDGKLRVAAYHLENSVVIRFSDNGPGISSAERLFQPFQPGASSTGLGLFVSRAIVRTFGGELHHTQQPGECCFIVELPAIAFAAKGDR
jgi:two-component system, LuxR family, sensor kinase FixL